MGMRRLRGKGRARRRRAGALRTRTKRAANQLDRIMLATPPRFAQARFRPGLLLVGVVFVLGAAAGVTLRPGGLGTPPHAPPALPEARYAVEVLRVYDGDTFQARVRVPRGAAVVTKVRLRGIDTPERDARCAEEAAKADEARRALARILAEGEVVISRIGGDRYGRAVAAVATRATPDVSDALLRAGVARRYEGGRRDGWCGGAARKWGGMLSWR